MGQVLPNRSFVVLRLQPLWILFMKNLVPALGLLRRGRRWWGNRNIRASPRGWFLPPLRTQERRCRRTQGFEATRGFGRPPQKRHLRSHKHCRTFGNLCAGFYYVLKQIILPYDDVSARFNSTSRHRPESTRQNFDTKGICT